MILFKFASRSRPRKFIECIENIYINARSKDFYIMATLDIDDTTMNNEDMIAHMRRFDKLYPIFGTSKTKIEAYNRDLDKLPVFDILINMSDDMLFVEQGFDEIIMQDMADAFPDGDGMLHYNDGNQRDNIITMPIMGRKYFERTGYIYEPSYESLFCDNEQTEVAKVLGCYKYMGHNKIIFRHYHPAWGYGQMDAQYEKTEDCNVWDRDERNYLRRKRENFGLGYVPMK